MPPPATPATRKRRTSIALPTSGAGSKLATTVARRIVGEVIERGWPVGEVLGSETELQEQYGVSRAVFREAVRLVENQQVARMRRGPGGGLVVTEPTVDAIIDAAVLYLHRANARLDEVFEARVVLEEIVSELAPARLDESDVTRLRQLIENEASGQVRDHRALHAMLASITRNPALELFVDILNRVSLLYFRDSAALTTTTLSESQHAHAQIAVAVIAGDAGLARHRMGKHLRAEADFLHRRRSSRQLIPDAVALGGAVSNKRAEDVARAILHDVIVDDLPPGHLLGSETELIERSGVSRAVFREAVRLLEHHQIAAMRRGPGGGMFVTPPSVDAVTEVVAVYLARRGMQVAHLAELRMGLELVLVELATQRAGAAGAEQLRDSLRREQGASGVVEFADAAHDLHSVIAALAGNRVLELLALVLIRLTRLHQVDRLTEANRGKVADEVFRSHEGIALAIAEGDEELARHRLRRHLEVVVTFLR
jgi:DNA-binding FadR family transcriptional regulator